MGASPSWEASVRRHKRKEQECTHITGELHKGSIAKAEGGKKTLAIWESWLPINVDGKGEKRD